MKRRKYTPWIPLASYQSADGNEHLVQARRNLKTGLIEFHTSKIDSLKHSYGQIGLQNIIDVGHQWALLVGDNGEEGDI